MLVGIFRFDDADDADGDGSDDADEPGNGPGQEDGDLDGDDELTLDDLKDLEDEQDSDVYTSDSCGRSLAKVSLVQVVMQITCQS